MTEYGTCLPYGVQCEYVAKVEAQAAEIERLKSIVRGWHYLAVGPDEMGDYYTQKALIKASEPYADPALAGKAEQ
jgi:hypothetical protein